MSSVAPVAAGADAPRDELTEASEAAVSKQIRGSSLLVAGRVFAVVVNMVSQVFIVRYLSRGDYGAFVYALSLVNVAVAVIPLGLDKASSRFAPIYEENGEPGKLWGLLRLQFGVVVGFGLAVVLAVLALQDWLAGNLIQSERAVAVLAIAVVAAPIGALDKLLANLLAVFAKPRQIFLRRHVLAPLLKLGVAASLLVGGRSVEYLAWGWAVVGVIGVVLYAVMVRQVLVDRGLMPRPDSVRVRYPLKEAFGFGLPLFATDLLYLGLGASDALVLGKIDGTEAVAGLRVIQSPADTNHLVAFTFSLLFTPLAARFFARGDRAGVRELYWKTAAWITVVTFPIFALTATMSTPVTLTLYGEQYRDSALYLSLIASAIYANTAFGFNGATLQVFGHVRYPVLVAMWSGIQNLVLNLLLVPRFGATGAAAATAFTMMTHLALRQWGLQHYLGAGWIEKRYRRVYVSVVAGGVALAVVGRLFEPNIVVAGLLVAVVSAILGWSNRHVIAIGDSFPELGRLPMIGPMLTTHPDR